MDRNSANKRTPRIEFFFLSSLAHILAFILFNIFSDRTKSDTKVIRSVSQNPISFPALEKFIPAKQNQRVNTSSFRADQSEKQKSIVPTDRLSSSPVEPKLKPLAILLSDLESQLLVPGGFTPPRFPKKDQLEGRHGVFRVQIVVVKGRLAESHFFESAPENKRFRESIQDALSKWQFQENAHGIYDFNVEFKNSEQNPL